MPWQGRAGDAVCAACYRVQVQVLGLPPSSLVAAAGRVQAAKQRLLAAANGYCESMRRRGGMCVCVCVRVCVWLCVCVVVRVCVSGCSVLLLIGRWLQIDTGVGH